MDLLPQGVALLGIIELNDAHAIFDPGVDGLQLGDLAL